MYVCMSDMLIKKTQQEGMESHAEEMHACMHACTCMYACMYVRTYVCIYIYIYIYICIHTYVHIYIHTFIHPYAYTQSSDSESDIENAHIDNSNSQRSLPILGSGLLYALALNCGQVENDQKVLSIPMMLTPRYV